MVIKKGYIKLRYLIIVPLLLLGACSDKDANYYLKHPQQLSTALLACKSLITPTASQRQACEQLAEINSEVSTLQQNEQLQKKHQVMAKWFKDPKKLGETYLQCLQQNTKLSKEYCYQVIELTDKTALSFYNTHPQAFINDQQKCYATSVLLDTPECHIMARFTPEQQQQLTEHLTSYLRQSGQQKTLQQQIKQCQYLLAAPLLSTTQVFYKSSDNPLCNAVDKVLIEQQTLYYKTHKKEFNNMKKLCSDSIYGQLNPQNQFTCHIIRQLS